MAGHRKKHGRPSRPEARRDRMQGRLAAAATAEEQLAAAFDWFRMALRFGGHPGEALNIIRQKTADLAATAAEWDARAIREHVMFPGERGRGVTQSDSE